jgi:hypothetical protein
MIDNEVVKQFVDKINSNWATAYAEGYENYAEMVWKNCLVKTGKDRFNFLINEIATVNIVPGYGELTLPLNTVLHNCFEAITTNFGFKVEKTGDNYTVKGRSGEIIGYFTINISSTCNKTHWFDVEAPIDGCRNGKVNLIFDENSPLSMDHAFGLWHEIGHAVHHVTSDLNKVNPDLKELGGFVFEALFIKYYTVIPERRNPLKKTIAIAFCDMEMSQSSGSYEEEDIISLIPEINKLVGVDLRLEDFGACVFGNYIGTYFTYIFCYRLVSNNLSLAIELVGGANELIIYKQGEIELAYSPQNCIKEERLLDCYAG